MSFYTTITEINTNMYEYAAKNMHAQQMLHYSLYMKSNQVTCSLSYFLEH